MLVIVKMEVEVEEGFKLERVKLEVLDWKGIRWR